MTRNKQLLVLLVIMFGLVGVLVLRSNIQLEPTDTEHFTARRGGGTSERVAAISLVNQAGALELVQENGIWMADELPVDRQKVDLMLASIFTPQKIVIVSETGEQHEKLGVTDELGTKVTIRQAAGDLVLVIGNPGQDGRYVRFSDEERVFLVPGMPRESILTTISDWVDRVLTRIPQSSLKLVQVTRGQDVLTLRQEESSWYVGEGNEAIDTTNINSVFNTLTSFVTQGLAETEPSGNPYMQVTLERDGAGVINLDFYQSQTEGEVVVKSSERAGFYVISEATAENFEIDETDLKVPIVTE
jgi:hypothetical protein